MRNPWIVFILLAAIALGGLFWLVEPDSSASREQPTPSSDSPAVPPPEPGEPAMLADAPSAEIETKRDRIEESSLGQRSGPDSSKAHTISKEWTGLATQSDEPEVLWAVLEEIRKGLRSSDPTENLAALMALGALMSVEFEREPFQVLVRGHYESPFEETRKFAVWATLNLFPALPAFQQMQRFIEDPSPEVRATTSDAICLVAQGRLTGPAAVAVGKILDRCEPETLGRTLAGITVSIVSPDIEERLLRFAKDPKLRKNIIQNNLGRLIEKSERVVDFLIRASEDPDPKVQARALWGLGHGIPVGSHRKVADASLRALQTHSDLQTQEECLKNLRAYGDATHLPDLDTFAANATATPFLRRGAESAAQEIRKRASASGR